MADENESVQPDHIESPIDQGDSAEPGPSAAVSDSSDAPLNRAEIESLLNEVPHKAGATQASPETRSPQTAHATQEDAPQGFLNQDEIDKLLGKAGPATVPGASDGPGARDVPQGEVHDADIECLFDQAEQALRSIDSEDQELPSGSAPFEFREFAGAAPTAESATLDLISDVELDLKIELGRTHMYLEDVLKLRRGAVVPLDKLAGDPVDIYVNGRLIARGEVLVLNDNFCVRVAELIAGSGVQ